MSNRKSSYKLIIFAVALFVISLGASSAFSQVTVSGSTGANGAYTTVGAAFTAINGAGTQAGNNIVVEISANTAESGPAVLNSSDWTSLLVRPSADGVTVSGATTTGRGLIELNGADLVTIDGDNPNTGGTNRNLTFQNTAANTITYTSVIRVCVAAAQVSADFNIIRNLNLIGSATGRNAAANTSTTGSENTTFGVVAGGNGGASVPTAITSVTGTAPAGTTINLLSVDNNSIVSVARGVGFFGSAAANSTGVAITNNTIGGSGALVGDPPYTSPANTVYTKGVIVQGTTALTVAGNTIRNILSYVGTTMAGIELTTAIGTGALNINNNSITGVVNNGTASGARGIDIASNTSTAASVSGNTVSNIQCLGGITIFGMSFVSTGPASSAVVQKNNVSGVNSRGTGTFGAYGMSINSGTGVTVRNNFISDVQHNMSGGGAFSTTFGVFGLRIAGGTLHQVYNNSVNLYAAYLGTPTSSLLSAAFAILGTGQTGMDIRNNIFSNTITGGTTSIAHVSVYLPSGGTSAMALTMNNNDYVFGADTARQGSGQAGTTAGTNFFTTFNPAAPSPASNLRSYTNTLNGVGNDDLSISADPQFNSPTDLHVSGVSPVLNIGASIGSVTDDIDGDARPLEGTYDIGADERLTVVSPGQIQLTAAAYGGNEGTSVLVTATRTGGTSGAVSVSFAMADISATGGAACGGSVDYVNTGGTFNWSGGVGGSQSTLVSLCSDATSDPAETFSFTISGPTGGATLGSPTVATVTITDVPPPLSGTYTVGGGGSYPSLTNPGGIFEAINLSGTTGPVTIDITSDLTGETGAIALNQIASGFSVLIKPSGAPRSITSTATATGLIILNGADNVTIDGSLSGGTDRSLSLINSNSTGSGTTVVALFSAGIGAGATGNTIKNTIIQNGTKFEASSSSFNFGIYAGSGASATSADLDNLTIQNNLIQRTQIGIQAVGFTGGVLNGLLIQDNEIGGAVLADYVGRIGIISGLADGAVINRNLVRNIEYTAAANGAGIVGSTGLVNSSITKNQITNLNASNTGGYGMTGISIETATAASGLTVANNFVSDIRGYSWTTSVLGDTVVGIRIRGTNTGGINLWYNSVHLYGNYAGSGNATVTSALMIHGTGHTNLDIRNNILVNLFDNTAGLADRSYSIYTNTANTMFNPINHNDYLVASVDPGVLGAINAVDVTTLAALAAATGGDANSISADPLFTSNTDLRTLFGSPTQDQGTAVAVLDDIDGNIRSVVGFAGGTPDMGAKERLGPTSSAASAGGRVMTASGQGIRGAAIVVTGNSLPTPIIVKTGSLGYFQVDGLQTGETYVFTVVSKRFTFSQPSRVINMTDNISDLDFVSDPLE